MAVKLSSLKSDAEIEAKGIWQDAPDIPGVSFLVSPITLEAYQTARDTELLRLSSEYPNGKVPQSVMSAFLGSLAAKHLLHGWKGFDMDYSPVAAHKTLCDPDYKFLVSAVMWCADKVSRPKIEFIEEEAKNSEKPSGKGSA